MYMYTYIHVCIYIHTCIRMFTYIRVYVATLSLVTALCLSQDTPESPRALPSFFLAMMPVLKILKSQLYSHF